ncbi:hypothetical protein FQR65_LT00993 [Abscondita terminalis]|nr:hypothetical protein FQR65_LT00993 [Abscondita terminalis]
MYEDDLNYDNSHCEPKTNLEAGECEYVLFSAFEKRVRRKQDLDLEPKYYVKMMSNHAEEIGTNTVNVEFDKSTLRKKKYTKRRKKVDRSTKALRNLSLNESSSSTSSPYLDDEVKPMYRGFQLIGDDSFLRFAEELLSYKSFIPLFTTGSTRRISYCRNGQTIEEMEIYIGKNLYPIGQRIILLVGSNDFLKNASVEDMYRNYTSLVKFLEGITEHLVLLTVPPIPELAESVDHWVKLKTFNDKILSLANGKKVFAFDSASLFISYCNSITFEFFQQTSNQFGRQDINKLGLKLLKTLLDVNLEKYGLV